MIKLNLGSGQHNRPGYVNIDKFDTFSPEIVWDLEVFPWPLDDSVASEIVMHHSLEHMGASADQFLGIMKELYRVTAPGGLIDILVPHPRSDGFIGDPTHVRAITPQLMTLFSKEKCRECAENGWANTPFALFLDVDFDVVDHRYGLAEPWRGRFDRGEISTEELSFAVSSYYNVIDEIKIILRVVK